MVTFKEKQELKKQLVASLQGEKDIRKVVIFGSFLISDNPQDMDVAVFQDSSESYIKLAMRYRKMTRTVSQKIPIDIFPIRPNADDAMILSEIANGEIVYEK
jgi:predicted nucleotidyltransferase